MNADRDHQFARGLSQQALHANVDQVAYLVPDLAEGIREWDALLGEQKWIVYEYSAETLPRLGFRGGPGEFVMRLALAGAGPQIELIEPVRGPSIYHEWVHRRGYGPHHVGRFVADIDAAMDSLRTEGREPVQWGAGYGLDGDGGFAYYELGPGEGTIVELIQPPRRRRTSEPI